MFQTPHTEEEWKTVSREFYNNWNYPNCLGALDGKHVVVIKPPKSESMFMNYKQTFSVVLMAVVDANYKFLYVNVGAQGRISDAGVFNDCAFAEAIDRNDLHFPEPTTLPGSDVVMPHMLVADEAFPLRLNIMKPFPRRNLSESDRVFNYRVSRARRVVENAFGILSAKFRVFKAPLSVSISTVRQIVMATTALHNFLRCHHNNHGDSLLETTDAEDTSTGIVVGGTWRSLQSHGLCPLRSYAGRVPANAKQMRQQLSKYFIEEGAVGWQRRCAGLEH